VLLRPGGGVNQEGASRILINGWRAGDRVEEDAHVAYYSRGDRRRGRAWPACVPP
jgi:hypothetical protein